MLYPDEQAAKVAMIRQLAPLLTPLNSVAPGDVELPAVRAALDTLQRRLTLAADTAGAAKGIARVKEVRDQVEGLRRRLEIDRTPATIAALDRLQADLARDFFAKLREFRKNLQPRVVAPGEAPPELRQRYIGASGRYLIRIQPAVDIWQQAGAERFIADLRSVDPDVTGPPVTSFEAIRLIRRGYFEGAFYAFALVAVVAGVTLRSVRGTLLALAPLALTVLWALGLMHVFDLRFNMANVWAVPLIIGISAELGINIYVRFLEARDTGGPVLVRSTVMGVLLNGLTTVVGFASLMFARHQGISGLGLLLTIGAGASLIAALVVLPVLIELFGVPPTRSRPLPSTAPDQKPVSA
jgi:hypothetical protein